MSKEPSARHELGRQCHLYAISFHENRGTVGNLLQVNMSSAPTNMKISYQFDLGLKFQAAPLALSLLDSISPTLFRLSGCAQRS